MLNNYNRAVDTIQTPEDLKQRTAQMMKQPFQTQKHKMPALKVATYLAMVAVIALGVMVVPRILKPVLAVAPTAQGGSASMVNGLYHDSEIQNILVLGVERYSDSNVDYTNTMLLVSVDKRHNKLKVTSIDGGIYADVPGYQKSRLCLVYSLGKAPLTVKTIENSFGIAIDNYITMDSDAYAKIIDCFGNATVKVSVLEAEEINQNSGEESSKRLTAGTVKLTGKQLLYYRHLQDLIDYAIAPPDVLSDLIENKLKSSDATEMDQLLNKIFPLVATNINKNTLTELASSLTGINYPITSNKVPAGNTFHEIEMPMSGSTKSQLVQIPDFMKNKQLFAKFIYEEDFSFPAESSNAASSALIEEIPASNKQ